MIPFQIGGEARDPLPERMRRFFKGEALFRWNDLSADDVLPLHGHRDELIAFLQERYGLSVKRATLEADSFISDIQNRIHSAVAGGSPPAARLPILKIPA